jgi:serine/threonine-protein kinase
MILLGVLVLIAVMGGILWFSGGGTPNGSSGATTSKSASGAASSAKGSGSAAGSASATAPKTPTGTPADAFPPADSTLCQGSTTVAVNSTTSCEFANNVVAAIPASASGTFVVTATSPVTQKAYEMICVKGTYTVCTGGVNAMVFVK